MANTPLEVVFHLAVIAASDARSATVNSRQLRVLARLLSGVPEKSS
jgi:hypothetical protein